MNKSSVHSIEMFSAKIAVTGDGSVGKTHLLWRYVNNALPQVYEPTVFDHFMKDTQHDNIPIRLHLLDNAGQEDYDYLRPVTYTGADMVVMCFSLDSPASLANVRYKWAPEAQKHAKEAVHILVGTKLDLRDSYLPASSQADQNRRPRSQCVTTLEGQAMADAIGAAAYIECSALTYRGIENLFDTALHLIVLKKELYQKTQSKSCCVVQ